MKPPFTSSIEQTRARMTFVGVLFLVLGVIALVAPIASTFVATIVIGLMLVAGGAVRLFHGFTDRHEHNMAWITVSSILYVLAGIAVLWRPLIGTLSLTLVVGTFFLVGAVSKALHAYQFRGTSASGWLIFESVLSGVLGILLLAGLPTTAFWALGAIVGVDLIVAGITWLALASPQSSAPSV